MHGGEHHRKSGSGRLKLVYSQDMRSVHMSGEHLGSMSNVKVSCPASFQTFDTLFVPQQMSQMSIGFLLLEVQCCNSLWPHGRFRVCEAH